MISSKQAIVGGVAALLVLASIAYAVIGSAGTDEGNAATVAKNYSILKDDRAMGSPKAPIVMIEYAAPSCPHCAHFSANVLPQVKKAYIDTGKVYYILRIYPLMAADGAIAGMAKCMPADRYFSFIDLAYRRQANWDPEYGVTDVRTALVRLGRIAGWSTDKIDRCMADRDELDRINHVAQDGNTRYDIKGVPTFVIDGTVVQATEADWPQLRARFNAILAQR